MNSRRVIARSLVWLLLPALLVAGLPGSLCACLVAAKSEKACCGAMDHAAAGKCCCTDAQSVPCGCCPKDAAPTPGGECGCNVQAAKPAVAPDAQAATHFDLAPQWVTWDLAAVAAPCIAEVRGWQFSLPPPDLVIELRNLRI